MSFSISLTYILRRLCHRRIHVFVYAVPIYDGIVNVVAAVVVDDGFSICVWLRIVYSGMKQLCVCVCGSVLRMTFMLPRMVSPTTTRCSIWLHTYSFTIVRALAAHT